MFHTSLVSPGTCTTLRGCYPERSRSTAARCSYTTWSSTGCLTLTPWAAVAPTSRSTKRCRRSSYPAFSEFTFLCLLFTYTCIYSRTCLGRPLVWATTRLGRPQSPARIVSNNKVPGVSDHLPDATSDRVVWFNQR